MNTAKILDIMPQAPPGASAVTWTPIRPEPRMVPPITEGEAAGLRDRRAKDAAREAERRMKEKRPDPPQAAPTQRRLEQEIGVIGNSFRVFVDLVSPPETYRVRIFGPPDSSHQRPAGESAKARAAYSAGTKGDRLGALVRADV